MSASAAVVAARGLRHLGTALPTLLDDARQEHLSYDAFLHRALTVEARVRHARMVERRSQAAHLPARKSLDACDFS